MNGPSSLGVAGGDAESVSSSSSGLASPPVEVWSALDTKAAALALTEVPLCFLLNLFFSLARLESSQHSHTLTSGTNCTGSGTRPGKRI